MSRSIEDLMEMPGYNKECGYVFMSLILSALLTIAVSVIDPSPLAEWLCPLIGGSATFFLVRLWLFFPLFLSMASLTYLLLLERVCEKENSPSNLLTMIGADAMKNRLRWMTVLLGLGPIATEIAISYIPISLTVVPSLSVEFIIYEVIFMAAILIAYGTCLFCGFKYADFVQRQMVNLYQPVQTVERHVLDLTRSSDITPIPTSNLPTSSLSASSTLTLSFPRLLDSPNTTSGIGQLPSVLFRQEQKNNNTDTPLPTSSLAQPLSTVVDLSSSSSTTP